ncbi:response regulator [Pseudobacteriovorax antillogorgiicola]|uniref:CheY chemotaxis protein or a CheY-like REC (Receiver) domain n=2 Tax=Pseudobacteriovorax antillogorgiicola TaxID=1513793 RepID=A0A1Y6CJ13_9BACT|nr:response regulator [Pseudobacteriovorax antillogorgiicola]TCS46420.1 CheY-like chemotaxis protein [Pseudobacteriovorax antillogorgiicola]SMF68984.1 CheY chemotaxis protein or a CheY-like REC (receiver) domain [Pseudobacteriovorax antillogorgiicola]
MPAPSLTDKNSNVVIIDGSGTLRPVVGGILRDLGYRNVFALKSLSEYLSYPNKYQVAWILTHPYIADPVTVFHLLKICLQDPKLRYLRITVFFDDSEQYLIPFAFSLGTMSFHVGTLSHNSIRNDLKEVISMARSDRSDIAIAARFFRKYLMSREWYMDRLMMEQMLLEGVDQSSEQLLNTAEAYFLTGQEQEGVSYLYETLMFDNSQEELIERMANRYMGKSLKECRNPIKKDTCVVIDSDEAVRKPIAEILSKLDFRSVMEFEDGLSALEFSRKYKNIDLFVTEWKLKEIPGPAFIQIVRHELEADIPIVVCSSLLKDKDEILLKEVGVNKVISKPIQARNFIASILSALKESQYPSELSSKEREFRLKLKSAQTQKAESILNSLLVDSKVPRGKKVLLQGEFALHEGSFQEAKRLGQLAAQIMGYGTFVLNLLGKACLKLGDHENALNYLEKANSLSPQNLERLCAIATEQSAVGRDDDARKTMGQVLEDAPNAAFAKEAQLSIAVRQGEHQEASNLLGNMDSSDSLISFWNSQAISHVKQQNFLQGIEIYQRALRNLPPGYSDNRSFVRYNVALAYTRSNQLKKAATYLEAEAAMTHSPVHKKVCSLLSKVLKSLKTGEPIQLQGSEVNIEEIPRPSKNFYEVVNSPIPPGGRFLWGLYSPDQAFPKEIMSAFESDEQSQAS